MTIPALICAAIVMSALGGWGGNLQPSRLVILATFPFIINLLIKKDSSNWLNHVNNFQKKTIFFVGILLLISLISIIWSSDRTATFGYTLVLSVNLLPLLSISFLDQRRLPTIARWLSNAWTVLGLILLLLSIVEILTGSHFTEFYTERSLDENIRDIAFASGFHGNYNDFSLILLFCIIGTMLHAEFDKLKKEAVNQKIYQFIRYGTVLGCVIIIYINGSRAGIISATMLIGALFANFIKIKLLFPIAISIFGLLSFFYINGTLEQSTWFQYIESKFTDYSSDIGGDEGRISILKTGVDGLIDTFGFGSGAGAYNLFLSSYNMSIIPAPHNLMLELALDFGLLGFLVCLWYVRLLWKATRSGSKSFSIIRLSLILLPLMGIIQSHLTGFTYFWLFIATLIATAVSTQSMHPENGRL